MEIKHLQYFMEVTKSGSFTQAANQLYITQPAISRIIKSLEEELGTTLFIRSRKKLVLTEEGQVVYQHAKSIEAEYQTLLSNLGQFKQLKKGHMRIGLPSITNGFFFSQLIAPFHRQYPDITFQLEEDGSKRIEEKVHQGELDLGVVVLPATYGDFACHTFIHEGLKLVVPTSHRFARRKSMTLHELEEEAFIMFNKDFSLRDSIVKACQEAGFKPKILLETSQLDFIEEMVASNIGVAILPDSTCQELTREVTSIPVTNPAMEWKLALIWRRDSNLSYVIKEFIHFAEEKLHY